MDGSTFNTFLARIADLTRSQCAHVLEVLKPIVDQGMVAAVIEQAAAGTLHCPRCKGTSLYRHGVKSGLQRFRCRGCARTLNSLTGTPQRQVAR